MRHKQVLSLSLSLAFPLVLVSPGVPYPDQVRLVLLPPAGVHPEQPRDGVGVALHQSVLVGLVGQAPVALPRTRDESLRGEGAPEIPK